MSALGFAAPWVLLASLAVVAPIIAHLARHEDREGRGFPSLMFLRRVPFPSRSRRKLADRALLALRVLAVLALVLSFAQPYLRVDDPQAGLVQRARVVLLDRSYSMGLGERFDKARRAAREALAHDDDNTRVALVVFDANASTVSSFAAGSSAALQALQAVRPGNRPTDLSKALNHASRLLANELVATREVVLISDLQRSGLGADPVLASGIDLQVRRVDDDEAPNNLAVLDAWYEHPDETPQAAGSLHVRIANTGSVAIGSKVRVLVDGLQAAQQQVVLEAGERRELLVPIFAAPERAIRVQVALDEDSLAIDNARYLLIAAPRPIKVLWLGNSSQGNPYVNVALSSATRGARMRVQSVDVAKVDVQQIDAADVIALDGVIAQTSHLAQALSQRVAQGGGLLTLATSPPAPLSGALTMPIAGMSSASPTEPSAAHGDGSVRVTALAALAPEHAIAASLGEASLSGIAVWSYQTLKAKANEQVLLRFEDGSPALIEREHGLGRSITLALPLQPQASDLVLDPVFVPWLVESLLYLSQHRVARMHYEPGDVLEITRYADAVVGGDALASALRARRPVQLRTPGGAQQALLIDQQQGPASALLGQVGFYELQAAQASPLPIAVNPVAGESILDALGIDQFHALVRRIELPKSSALRAASQGPRDTRIAKYLLWLALVALLAEALCGAWLARRRGAQQVNGWVGQRDSRRDGQRPSQQVTT